MSLRRVVLLAVALVALPVGRAAADQASDERDARALGNVVFTALATGETRVLASSMRAPIDADVEPELPGACKKKFKPTVRVARAKLAAFTGCLAALKIDVRGGEIAVIADAPGFVVAANNGDVNVRLVLRRVKSDWKVIEIDVHSLIGGVEGGIEGGVVGGVIGGAIGAPPPPPPPPPPPSHITPTVLETMRTAGSKQIGPDQATIDAMAANGVTRITAPVKLCLDRNGAVVSTKMLKASGYPDYDAKLMTTIKSTWTYKPFLVNGKAVPVCSVVMFIFVSTP